MIIYVVKPGDTIYSLSKMYGVSPIRITSENQLRYPQNLVVGQALVISSGGTSNHVVQQGQSLYSIARSYGVSEQALSQANPTVNNVQNLQVGQQLNIPQTVSRQGRSIEVNGYAYPFISTSTLASTLPYLTYLSIFSYDLRPDGTLSRISDEPLIRDAYNSRVAPLMVVTNIREGGSFDSGIARALLTDPEVQSRAIENIVAVAKRKGYHGVDLDLEYVYADDRQLYNELLRTLSQRLHSEGLILTTAVAPKNSAQMRGLLYEGHDYSAHGRYADRVTIMTYEWGYMYGPPQAVAPVNLVERVISYAVTDIPPDKILMGIPNYGYDWTLPFTQGSAARIITNPAAVNLAAQVGAEIQFDETAQTPFFRYYDSQGRQHEVWFEDARSIQAKLMLVEKYNLAGVTYWNIDNFFRQNWLVLSSMYGVTRVI